MKESLNNLLQHFDLSLAFCNIMNETIHTFVYCHYHYMHNTSNNKQIQSHPFNTLHADLTWFTPGLGATSTKLCFYYISWGKLAQFVALQLQCKVSPRSLIFSLYLFPLSSLSANDYLQTQNDSQTAMCLDRYNAVCLTDFWIYNLTILLTV